MRWSIVIALLLPVLLIAHVLCYQVALPVVIDMHGRSLTIHVGSQSIALIQDTPLTSVQFAPHSPVVHEYQIDGSDSTNNFTLDQAYLTSLSTSFYYRFQTWMRGLDDSSRWLNLQLSVNGQSLITISQPINGQRIPFPPTPSLHLSVELQRPETPMELDLTSIDQTTIHIMLDRNDHAITVMRDNLAIANVYFPVDVAPFAAMVLDFFLLTTIWAICILLLLALGDVCLGSLFRRLRKLLVSVGAGEVADERWGPSGSPAPRIPSLVHHDSVVREHTRPKVIRYPQHGRPQGSHSHRNTTPASMGLHPIAWVALLASFIFVSWIALVQYHAQPHIYDASAYLFAAKMYALGHLSVPIPPAVDRFPGPFMVQFQGQWFTQYAPGTSLTLVPGIWLGMPWLIEPLLGTLALLGIGLIAAQLYDGTTATIAVLMGVLSPFYSYLAASYLSHTIALFYLVWAVWAFLRFLQGKASWYLLLSATLFGMAGLTRDLVVLLFICIIVPGLLLLSWQKVRQEWRRWLLPAISFMIILLIFIEVTLSFNKLLTDSWFTTPRSLFFTGDHWGFGQGVGFYGQHTLAGGLVNLDELLTILAIDLFGWPFYLTLAFLCVPFLIGKATRYDWLFLVAALLLTFAWVGYFYHGIYLGPRYLYETLPFLLILTARGIIAMNDVGRIIVCRGGSGGGEGMGPLRSPMLGILLIVLLACSLGYYLPRQIALYNNYSGLPPAYHLDLSAIYSKPPMHHAIITTDDYAIYQLVLFPLNDPLLHDDVIYAHANNTADFTELHKAFPDRQLYSLQIAPDGSITYAKIST